MLFSDVEVVYKRHGWTTAETSDDWRIACGAAFGRIKLWDIIFEFQYIGLFCGTLCSRCVCDFFATICTEFSCLTLETVKGNLLGITTVERKCRLEYLSIVYRRRASWNGNPQIFLIFHLYTRNVFSKTTS